MYTSVTESAENPGIAGKTALCYLTLSLVLLLAGAVYERFSHEVYVYCMLYAHAIPLAGGALPFALLALRGRRGPGRRARNFYHAGIATLTVGCFLQGVLEIYGTSNRLLWAYPIAGGLLILCGLLAYGRDLRRPARGNYFEEEEV